jgi:hypothetical protein
VNFLPARSAHSSVHCLVVYCVSVYIILMLNASFSRKGYSVAEEEGHINHGSSKETTKQGVT